MKDFRVGKNIADVDEFNDYCSQMFDEFLQGFNIENGLIIDAINNVDVSEDWDFIYSRRGQYLAEKMIERLKTIGERYYPDEEIEIWSPLYEEC